MVKIRRMPADEALLILFAASLHNQERTSEWIDRQLSARGAAARLP